MTSESPTHPDAPRARRRTLKVYPEYFDALESGEKSFEFRKDDREPRYAVGDTLVLREWDPMVDRDEFMGDFTGRECLRRVTYVARGRFIPEGFCVMSIVPLRPDAPRAGGETPAIDRQATLEALEVAASVLNELAQELGGSSPAQYRADVKHIQALRSALPALLDRPAPSRETSPYWHRDWWKPSLLERHRDGERGPLGVPRDAVQCDWCHAIFALEYATDDGLCTFCGGCTYALSVILATASAPPSPERASK